jgi:hypothetical protein
MVSGCLGFELGSELRSLFGMMIYTRDPHHIYFGQSARNFKMRL